MAGSVSLSILCQDDDQILWSDPILSSLTFVREAERIHFDGDRVNNQDPDLIFNRADTVI